MASYLSSPLLSLDSEVFKEVMIDEGREPKNFSLNVHLKMKLMKLY